MAIYFSPKNFVLLNKSGIKCVKNAKSTFDGGIALQKSSEPEDMVTKDDISMPSPASNEEKQGRPKTTDKGSAMFSQHFERTRPSDYANVKSAFMEDEIVVKIKGTCGAEIGVFFVPPIFTYSQTNNNCIEVISDLIETDKRVFFDKHKFQNKCNESKIKQFKIVDYIKDNMLKLQWKVYPTKDTQSEANKENINLFRIPFLGNYIPTLHVPSWVGNDHFYLLGSKNCSVESDISDSLETDDSTSKIFMRMDKNAGKWHTRSLGVIEDSPLDEYDDYFAQENDTEDDITIEQMKSDEESNENKMKKIISCILKGIYKTDQNGNKKLITLEDLEEDLKEKLIIYCQLLKKLDTSGTLENHELGSAIDIFNNLTKFLQKHENESNYNLLRKLRNPAMCMKNVSEWITHRRGLVLPDSSCSNTNENDTIFETNSNWVNYVNDNIRNVSYNVYKGEDDGMTDVDNLKMMNRKFFNSSDNVDCNNEHSDEPNDKNGCVSKIDVEE
ncbi:serine-repeat antigen 4c [Plasmodium gonderi]|uniref:Serine-repeat antigen 4c n=1 Tax=Plasmodium gonderi TaxID=77519 RepID=A0A1Y1JAL4_PLAGO|nr:serine-repeat antigen 4c [Plasmodium gonderi]GAW79536.1 serine-repeat antigen 4c [Plasmodium gonderi]